MLVLIEMTGKNYTQANTIDFRIYIHWNDRERLRRKRNDHQKMNSILTLRVYLYIHVLVSANDGWISFSICYCYRWFLFDISLGSEIHHFTRRFYHLRRLYSMVCHNHMYFIDFVAFILNIRIDLYNIIPGIKKIHIISSAMLLAFTIKRQTE